MNRITHSFYSQPSVQHHTVKHRKSRKEDIHDIWFCLAQLKLKVEEI